MKNHYVFLPVAPLTADAVRSVMEVLDGAPGIMSYQFVSLMQSIPVGQGHQGIPRA